MTTYFVMSDEAAEKLGLPFGSDVNSGLSLDKPFKTITHAQAVASNNAPQNIEKIFVLSTEGGE